MGTKSKGIHASNRMLVVLICILSVTLVALLILGVSLGQNAANNDAPSDPIMGSNAPLIPRTPPLRPPRPCRLPRKPIPPSLRLLPCR